MKLAFNTLLLILMISASGPYSQAEEGRKISPHLIGVNLSYFNDLDYIWDNYEIPERLRQMDARILRYPGGEETSRWHWNMPGLNGYVDYWNPRHHNQTWQSTWVPPEEWYSNEAFMSIDEYFEHCIAIGAEPLLGVNMTSGEVNNRREDGIQMAVDMVKHVKNMGYPLRFIYLDNEPWHRHRSNYYLFPDDDYAELCVLYVDAIREVLPDVKFIANPFEAGSIRNQQQVRRFFEIAGNHVDIISIHFYWEWSRGTWDRWAAQFPMLNSSSWRSPEETYTFTRDLEDLRRMITRLGFETELAILEWNIAPIREEENRPTPKQLPLMQAEMLMQFLEAEMVMTTIWPTLWQVTPPERFAHRERSIGQSQNRGILRHDPPYESTGTYDMFRIFRGVSGGTLLKSEFLETGQYLQLIRSRDEQNLIIVLNKSPESYSLELPWLNPDSVPVEKETLSLSGLSERSIQIQNRGIELQPYSLNRIRLKD